ncbi:MFS transporter [Aeromicrobium sp. YIM 150415]|uniref:MFS transporter n=1 Tax=Aeromicrobium sp. YIM 150415 TaxID=2803912 RepID=UPI001964C4F7|nr:MFS transporter [Aeromicrobium sp. YIM 150415]MBM9465175.1 MFS transporter [Aeromicrobium sp. YIM 150415]
MTATASTHRPVRYPLWAGRTTALFAIAVSALNLRSAVTSLSPLLHGIGTEFGFGAGTIGVFGMLPPACFALFGVLTPVLIRRIGLEYTAIVALLITTAGVALRGLSGNTSSLILLSIVALAGMGIAGVVIPPLVREYFPDRLALMSSVYLIALHLGALLPPLLAVPFANSIGWRLTIAVWAVVAALAAALWAITDRVRRDRPHHHVNQLEADAKPVGVLPRHAWRSPTVWNLTVLFGMTSWNVFILFTWLPTLIIDAGHTAEFGGTMVSLLIGVSMIIGVFAPTLTIRLRNPAPLVEACVLLYVIGYAGIAMAPRSATVLWVILLGAASSLFIIATTMINTHSSTPAGSAVASGFVQGIGGAIAVLGPLLFGLLHTWTGTWGASYALVGASLTILTVTGIRERRHRTLEDDISHWERYEQPQQ